jgi:hypothetical protein
MKVKLLTDKQYNGETPIKTKSYEDIGYIRIEQDGRVFEIYPSIDGSLRIGGRGFLTIVPLDRDAIRLSDSDGKL